ncbi:MAG: glucosyl-3-phosphoglycerate synthase [Anaerolineae bacterium]
MTSTYERVLVALSDSARLDAWLDLAARLVAKDGEVCLRGMVAVLEGQSLSEGAGQARQWREALELAAERSQAICFGEHRAYVDYAPLRSVLEETSAGAADLVIVQWEGPDALTGGLGSDEILASAQCDVLLLARFPGPPAGPVLLPLRGGPNQSLGLSVANALAGGSSVTLLHAVDKHTRRSAAASLEVFMLDEPGVARTVQTSADIVDGILAEAASHHGIVLGAAPRELADGRDPIGPVIERVFRKTRLPVAVVRAYQPEPLLFHSPQVRSLPPASLSTRVDRWFAENTFHYSEFADLGALMALKERQGLTISIGLPALNEEATVGGVIQTLKTALMDDIPFVDEIALIDSASTDRTVTIAEDLGIPVYRHPEILPETGTYRGKGEALWKSLHVLKGDIVVWVDTDVTNMHPRFIYGLVGPLLKYSQLQYVKGFYRRPLEVGQSLQAVGGGRVTELVARPMFNLFYPELSGIIQPLSGEYAGRRSALEQVPFFTGYGVETALLVDLYELFGLEGLAQTDLDVRVHHNQSLVDLSKMSFAILQVLIGRMEERYALQLLDKANRSLKLIIQEPDRFGLEIQAIGDVERPPIITVPAYRELHDHHYTRA